ncbi:hypothetical protein [Spiroplasma endosymbiont of Atherix ibis]|uniref:hypothetical protein n=1 Tax=Spiroplasma endosymbiont of Atherix ibis TaxID=3066291 RepID=UPI0030D37417
MFEKYENMNKQDIEKNLEEIEKQYKQLLEEEKKIDKKVRKNLWIWFLFPLLGLLFYQIHLKKRKENDKNYYVIKNKKKDIIYVELEIQFLQSKLEKM